jgi:hypothetical protein
MQMQLARELDVVKTFWTSIKRNVGWGLGWALAATVVFGCFAIAMSVVSSSHALADAGLTLGQALALYVAGGLAGGVILGLLRPILGHLLGQMLAGTLILFVASCLYEWTTDPRPFATLLPRAALIAVFAGPTYAVSLWVYNWLTKEGEE